MMVPIERARGDSALTSGVTVIILWLLSLPYALRMAARPCVLRGTPLPKPLIGAKLSNLKCAS